MWQFMAAIDGYVKANTPEGELGLSAVEKDELWEWL